LSSTASGNGQNQNKQALLVGIEKLLSLNPERKDHIVVHIQWKMLAEKYDLKQFIYTKMLTNLTRSISAKSVFLCHFV